MKAFDCDACGSLVFFENSRCLNCSGFLGFVPERLDVVTLRAGEDGLYRSVHEAEGGGAYRLCGNGVIHQNCNWMIRAEWADELCRSCRLNQTIPDLSVNGNAEAWQKLESAKRRIVYTFLQLGLYGWVESNPPLRFDFVADMPGGERKLTGHNNGVITLNVAEAHDAERERRRINMHEPYRTLVGHFRHETGHYFWDRLIARTPRLDRFRALFGDERQDYGNALQRHYQEGPPADWQSRFVTAYASTHPWEDWAESWAHYLHIVDTIETAASFGIRLTPRHPNAETMRSNPAEATDGSGGFDHILNHWFPLTYALNSLNRGMGLPDLYPFVLSQPALEKLRFIHEVVRGGAAKAFDA